MANRVTRAIADLHVEPCDITIPHWRVRVMTDSDGPPTVDGIARRLAMDKVAVSRAVIRLTIACRLDRTEDPGAQRRLDEPGPYR